MTADPWHTTARASGRGADAAAVQPAPAPDPPREAVPADAAADAVPADPPIEAVPPGPPIEALPARPPLEALPPDAAADAASSDGAADEPAPEGAADGPAPEGLERPPIGEALASLLPARSPGTGVEPIPWRTIWTAIGIVVGALALIQLVLALQRVLGLIVISTFLAVVLTPAVGALVRAGIRRSMATGIVYLAGLSALGGLGYLFIHPLYKEALHLSNDLPDILARAQAGKGSLGRLIAHFHLQKTAATEIPKLRRSLGKLGGPALSLLRQVVSGLGGLVVVAVLTFLILLEGPGMVRGTLRMMPSHHAARVRRIIDDVARSVTGYVVGNAATSLIAGVVCGVTLLALGVPFAIVFGVWVAMVDLLPLVGGLLAGVPTVAFALLHSPTAGIITAVVFLVYQQVENHVLNPLIMSRTVRLNPLWVILSVLAGAQLASILGALLAIPVAGAIQIVLRDLWEGRRRRPAEPAPPTGGPPPPADPPASSP